MGNILCCFKKDIDQKDENGQTKLTNAAWNGNVDECRNLLSRGANINCTNNVGWSPLMRAAAGGYFSICVFLTDSGADVHLTDDTGNTALHVGGCLQRSP